MTSARQLATRNLYGPLCGLIRLRQLQIRSQPVRKLKPLLRCSRIGASASSSGTACTSGASHPVAASSIAPNPSPGTASSAQKRCLARWAAGAVAAGAVAAFIAGKVERAPVTGRPQFIFDIYKSAPVQRAAMPAAPDLPRADPSATPYTKCSQQGDEVMHAAYARVAEAVARLAAKDPALQSRLASIPDRTKLQSLACPQVVPCSHIHVAKMGSLWASLSIRFMLRGQLPSS